MRLNLEDRIDCNDRETTKDGFPYCRINNLNCPYVQLDRLVDLGIQGCFHPCNFIPLKRGDYERNTEDRRIRESH